MFLDKVVDYGYDIINPNNDGAYVTADVKDMSTVHIKYFSEKNHIFMVEVIADTNTIEENVEFMDCVLIMTKSINPNLTDDSEIINAAQEALDNPGEEIILNDTMFKYFEDKKALEVAY